MSSIFGEYLEKIDAKLRQALPKEFSSAWRQEYFGALPEGSAIREEHFSPLLEPCRNLVELGGKRWRPLLLCLCAQMVSDSPEEALSSALGLVDLVELSHTASLIHDDIEDGSDSRRGAPAAHLAWGLDAALNAGSWLYFMAAGCISSARISDGAKARLYGLYLRDMRRLHLGQAMDIAWHRDAEACPSPQEYMAMAKCKTGTLSSLAMQAGGICGGADEALAEVLGEIGADIGAGFQVLDDVVNLTTGNPGKKRGDDIAEGKKSLPVLLFLKDSGGKEKDELKKNFQLAAREGIDSPAVERAISILHDSGALDSASRLAASLLDKACERLEDVFPPEGNRYCALATGLFKDMERKFLNA